MACKPTSPPDRPVEQYAFHEFKVNANITPIMDLLLSAKPADVTETESQINVSIRVNLGKTQQDEVESRRGIRPTIRFTAGEHIQRELSNPLGAPQSDYDVLTTPEDFLNFMAQCLNNKEMPPEPWYDVVARARLTPKMVEGTLRRSGVSPTIRYLTGERLLSQQNIEDGTRAVAQAWAEENNTRHVSTKPLAQLPIEKADLLGNLLLDGWLTYENHLYQAAKPEPDRRAGGVESNLRLHGLEPNDLFE